MVSYEINGDIISRLPNYFDPARGENLPEGINNAEIVRIGTLPEAGAVEGGGLVIDYRPRSSGVVHRVVLAFNEYGMWLHTHSPTPGASQE